MWAYEKKLQYPVNIKNPNPALAKLIITQLGGPDGELGASLRYLSQRYAMPYSEAVGILTDIGREGSEMFHFLGPDAFLIVRPADQFVLFCSRITPLHREQVQIYINVIPVAYYHLI